MRGIVCLRRNCRDLRTCGVRWGPVCVDGVRARCGAGEEGGGRREEGGDGACGRGAERDGRMRTGAGAS